MTFTEESVEDLRDYIGIACDELVIVQYFLAQGEHDTAAARLEGALGEIEAALAVFCNGGLDS